MRLDGFRVGRGDHEHGLVIAGPERRRCDRGACLPQIAEVVVQARVLRGGPLAGLHVLDAHHPRLVRPAALRRRTRRHRPVRDLAVPGHVKVLTFHLQAVSCPSAGQRGRAFHRSVTFEPARQLSTEISTGDPNGARPGRCHTADQAEVRRDRDRRLKPVTGSVAHQAARRRHAITLANDQRREIHAFCPLHAGTAPAYDRGRSLLRAR